MEEIKLKGTRMKAPGMAGHLIRRLQQLSTQVYSANARAAGFDITSVQFAALDALYSQPDIDQATVAEMIGYDRATIGGVIERLVAKALVQREVNPDDRRAKKLRLTNEGEALFLKLLPVVSRAQEDILRNLTADEKAQFMLLARKVIF